MANHGRSHEIMKDIGDRLSQATALTDLGDTYLEMKEPGPAARARREALRLLRDLGHPNVGTLQAKLTALAGP